MNDLIFVWIVIAVLLVVIIAAVVRRGWTPPPLTMDPAGRMQLWKACVLLGYLMLATVVNAYAIYGLWAAEPQTPKVEEKRLAPCGPAAPATTAGGGTAPASAPGATGPGTVPPPATGGAALPPPKVQAVEPSMTFMGQGRSEVMVLGCSFAPDDKVLFNGLVHLSRFVNPQQIFVPLETSDFVASGNVFIAVQRDKTVSESAILQIRPAFEQIGTWDLFGREIPVNQELRLFAPVLITGSFGSCVFGLKSLADYIGARNLTESWFTFYAVKPLVGAGIGLLFYLVIRGGFLVGTNADVRAVNPFGVAAIAALVGAYADQAFNKLYDVFQTLFQTKPQAKAPDPRPDNIGAPLRIKTKSPLAKMTVGTRVGEKLEADGGTPPLKWTAVTPLPAWLTLSEAGELSGDPPAGVTALRLTVKVTDSTSRSDTAQLDLPV
jgi:hypothetical protein